MTSSAFATRKSVYPRLILAAALMLPACACSSLTAVNGMAPIVGAPAIQNPSVTVRVMQGDTLGVISQRHGVPVQAILAANGLRDANAIRIGQTLRIPASIVAPTQMAVLSPDPSGQPSVAELAGRPPARIPAIDKPNVYTPPPPPVAARPQPPAAKPPKPNIDRDAERELLVSARMTSLARPQMKPSNFAILVAGQKPATATAAVKPAKPATGGMGGPLILEKPKQVASVEPAKPLPPESIGPGQPDDFTATNKFIWPVAGRVISSFGEMFGGNSNDGINIEVAEGTLVKASDHGVVIYAGNELAGFGNLLLVKHSNGFVTAYAHNSKLLVKKGAKVRQGQPIAQAGRSGGVDRPQVHFEIRRGDKPVDPKRYMEGASVRL